MTVAEARLLANFTASWILYIENNYTIFKSLHLPEIYFVFCCRCRWIELSSFVHFHLVLPWESGACNETQGIPGHRKQILWPAAWMSPWVAGLWPLDCARWGKDGKAHSGCGTPQYVRIVAFSMPGHSRGRLELCERFLLVGRCCEQIEQACAKKIGGFWNTLKNRLNNIFGPLHSCCANKSIGYIYTGLSCCSILEFHELWQPSGAGSEGGPTSCLVNTTDVTNRCIVLQPESLAAEAKKSPFKLLACLIAIWEADDQLWTSSLSYDNRPNARGLIVGPWINMSFIRLCERALA